MPFVLHKTVSQWLEKCTINALLRTVEQRENDPQNHNVHLTPLLEEGSQKGALAKKNPIWRSILRPPIDSPLGTLSVSTLTPAVIGKGLWDISFPLTQFVQAD